MAPPPAASHFSVAPNDTVLLGAHTSLFKCPLILQINNICASLNSLTKPPRCVTVVLTALQQMWKIILHYTARRKPIRPHDPPSVCVGAVAARNVPSPPALGGNLVAVLIFQEMNSASHLDSVSEIFSPLSEQRSG